MCVYSEGSPGCFSDDGVEATVSEEEHKNIPRHRAVRNIFNVNFTLSSHISSSVFTTNGERGDTRPLSCLIDEVHEEWAFTFHFKSHSRWEICHGNHGIVGMETLPL